MDLRHSVVWSPDLSSLEAHLTQIFTVAAVILVISLYQWSGWSWKTRPWLPFGLAPICDIRVAPLSLSVWHFSEATFLVAMTPVHGRRSRRALSTSRLIRSVMKSSFGNMSGSPSAACKRERSDCLAMCMRGRLSA